MYILDTNILLESYKNLNKFDDDILLPITVIKELDKHKTDKNETGYHARKCIRLIDEAIENNTLQNDYKLYIDSEEYNNIDLFDDRILESCIRNKPNVFITNDLALRIKAKSKNIDAIKFNDNNFSDTPGKIIRVETDIDVINKINLDGSIDERLIDTDILYQNTCYILKDKYSSSSTLARRVNNEIIRIIPPKKLFGCVEPRNVEQKFYAEMLMNPEIKIILCSGLSGSGKSLIALAAGLQQVNSKGKMNRVVCCKPVVAVGQDIGFLPGQENEKLKPFYEAFYDNLNYIRDELDRSDYYEKGFTEVEMQHLGTIRGRTIVNAFMIGDEFQNTSETALKSFVSRAGVNSKVIICGDLEQIDVKNNSKYDNGLFYAQQKLQNHPKVGIISLSRVERSEISEIANLL